MVDGVNHPWRVDEVLQAAKSLGITGAPTRLPAWLLPLSETARWPSTEITLHALAWVRVRVRVWVRLGFLSYASALMASGGGVAPATLRLLPLV
jgi:hypothetical protein